MRVNGLFAVVLTGVMVAPALGQRSDSKIEVKAAAGEPDAKGFQDIRLDIEIEKGWHIYGNPVTAELLKGNATDVKVFSGGKPLEAVVSYPKGKLKKDFDMDGDKKIEFEYPIYEDKVVITARVKRGGDAGSLEIHIRVNACDKNRCLAQGTKKVKVP